MFIDENSIRLTQYSHDTGCGCKILPRVLEAIPHSEQMKFVDPDLLVGNETCDDATVYDLGNSTSVVSTTDFFMSIVDNPFDFDRIVATNAINNIFAMGGKLIMAITILGRPTSKLSPEIAHEAIEGGRYVCRQTGTALADSHSIDAPEPTLGLAVAGIVPTERVRKNSTAQAGYKLFLTKPLGIGALTTAKEKSLLKPEHQGLATETVCRMNIVGVSFVSIGGVKAMTDITGFGLLGHLSGMCQGAGVQARVDYNAIPESPGVEEHIRLDTVPGGAERSSASYSHLMGEMPRGVRDLLCSPQISGGLLLVVVPEAENEVKTIVAEFGIELIATGELVPTRGGRVMIEIR